MKASEVYFKAAQRIFNRRNIYSCTAIQRVASGYSQKYEEYFKPINSHSCFWAYSWGSEYSQDGINNRVIALLLMSEIARSEE